MFKTIADPADCEVRSVIRFLKVKPAEIHRQLVEIYGENVKTDEMVRKEEGQGISKGDVSETVKVIAVQFLLLFLFE
ncbi:hypothetical protein AVEN_204380-1 [Araneus ventricosus]|uniref:Mos1 transposase HTH domain-containing protein n=1 Tax=Araneus ventricosus TaxID=182803 RepID=A0A4Y2H316_ARAVE|nr:hypothetical protein AVEN_204380-1 [Araneus ventricosus]